MTKRLHRCATCGREARWDARWRWFGSYKDLDDQKPVRKFCSVACYEAVRASIVPNMPRAEHRAWRVVCALSNPAVAVLTAVVDGDGYYLSEVAHQALGVGPQDAAFRTAVAELTGAGLILRRPGRRGRVTLRAAGEEGKAA